TKKNRKKLNESINNRISKEKEKFKTRNFREFT
ncbi:unnamed protein product, partial [marine sediment metagenome]